MLLVPRMLGNTKNRQPLSKKVSAGGRNGSTTANRGDNTDTRETLDHSGGPATQTKPKGRYDAHRSAHFFGRLMQDDDGGNLVGGQVVWGQMQQAKFGSQWIGQPGDRKTHGLGSRK